MEIRIFEPNPGEDRWLHLVVCFPADLKPQAYKARSAMESQTIAAAL